MPVVVAVGILAPILMDQFLLLVPLQEVPLLVDVLKSFLGHGRCSFIHGTIPSIMR
jgi:hypothetical protein